MKSLERAVSLAEPESFVRLFVDEGPQIATLLSKVLRKRRDSDPRDGASEYAGELLQHFAAEAHRRTTNARAESPSRA